MPSSLLEQVAHTIHREQLLTEGMPLFIAVSGGADSVALLTAMIALGYHSQIHVLHCNFQLRGQESEGDEAFVQELCTKLNVPLEVKHFETLDYAHSHNVSVEMAARELRYDWFAEVLDKAGEGGRILVAHNADDQIETLLLNLATGTGLRGLTGMPYHRKDRSVVRPLLDCPRSLILSYLDETRQRFRTDSSNAELIYKRNVIRHKLIPLFESLNPSFRTTALRSISHFREAEGLLDPLIRQQLQKLTSAQGLNHIQLREQPYHETLLYEYLKSYGFKRTQVMEVLRAVGGKASGARFYSPTHLLICGATYLEVIEKSELSPQRLTLTLEDRQVNLPTGGSLYWEIVPRESISLPNGEENVALLDYSTLQEKPLILRSYTSQDYIYPLGMSGRKKVRKALTDARLNYRERLTRLILCTEDTPIWILGLMIDRRYQITDKTRLILRLQYSPRDSSR